MNFIPMYRDFSDVLHNESDLDTNFIPIHMDKTRYKVNNIENIEVGG